MPLGKLNITSAFAVTFDRKMRTTNEPYFLRVKICGITCVEDGLAAAEAGADFLGYIFHPPSPRFVTSAEAAEIIRHVREQFPAVKHVGVFVDADYAAMQKICADCRLDYAQLHGHESPQTCAALAHDGFPVIKVMRFAHEAGVQQWQRYSTELLLCDTYDKHIAGGTGRPFDLGILPHEMALTNVLIAGGLTGANVNEAAALRPFGVDVSSGVEESPGRKSVAKLREFFNAVSPFRHGRIEYLAEAQK